MNDRTETATLGGGCFWCLEAVYQELRGITGVVSGYAGGHVENPSYQQVCSGTTGHAEVVQVTFDPDDVDFRDLLRVFFTIHDPTTPNRQGGDVGPQYRSAIFTHGDEQDRIAAEVIQEIAEQGIWPGRVVTEVAPLERFYPAEAYHQNYFRTNPDQGYCRVVIAPKLAKFRKAYLERLNTSGAAL